jgi:hypothetical protein
MKYELQTKNSFYIINKKFEVKQENIGYLNWKDPSTCQHLKKLME